MQVFVLTHEPRSAEKRINPLCGVYASLEEAEIALEGLLLTLETTVFKNESLPRSEFYITPLEIGDTLDWTSYQCYSFYGKRRVSCEVQVKGSDEGLYSAYYH